MRLERREFKYLLAAETVELFRRSLAPYCILDPMCAQRPDHRYTIDSLYLDTTDRQLYASNDLELPRRFKARVRTYPDNADAPAYLEIKARDGDIIYKTRGAVPKEDVAALLEKPPHRVHDPNLERFFSLRLRHNLAPVCLVRYQREAWVSQLDPYTRVTFDTHIRHQRMEQWCLQSDPRQWRSNDAAPLTQNGGVRSPTILELKFERAVPGWLSRLVARWDLDRRAFSKYGTAMKAMLAPPEHRTSDGRLAP